MKSRYIRDWAFYVFCFLTAKATAFLGPIGLAYLSSASVYGAVELAFGYGVLLGPLFTLGVVVAAPQHILVEDDTHVLDRIALAVLVACGIGLCFFFLVFSGEFGQSLNDPLVMMLWALMIGPAAFQLALSTYSRTRGWKSAAAWLDNTATHLMWLTGLILFLLYNTVTLEAFVAVYSAACIAIMGLSVWTLKRFCVAPFAARVRKSIRIGYPMMLNGVAIFLVAGSSRVLIGTFTSPEELAGYAYLFRVGSVILLLHQFFMTAWAVRIYKETNTDVDNYLAAFCATISVAGIVVFGLLKLPFAQRITPSFVPVQNDLLVGLTVCQIVLWSLSASLEPRINRLLRAGRMAALTAIVAGALMVGVVLLSWLDMVNVPAILAMICVAQAIVVALQLINSKEDSGARLVLTNRSIFIGPCILLGLTILFSVGA